ncbi:formate dehydrogenase (NAD+), partial [Cystobasidiomycetes sp. EMM_F5]
LVTGRRWQGSAFGGVKGRSQMGGLISDWQAGKLKVSEFVTSEGTLEKINEGFDLMYSGHGVCVRHVISVAIE